MRNKFVDEYLQHNQYYWELLNKLVRSGETVYLYGSNIKVLPVHFDASFGIDEVDLMRTVLTVRLRCDTQEEYMKVRQYRYIHSLERKDQYDYWVVPGQPPVDSWPKILEAKIQLKYVAEHPFAGMPAGDLLYSKE